jgi:hypothetical protein
MRHVLRARAEAVRALAGFFERLERECAAAKAAGSIKKVRASAHLARTYGSWIDGDVGSGVEGRVTADGMELVGVATGWRSAAEVLGFLRVRGAKIPTLEGEWAALSDEEVSFAEDSDKDDWVRPTKA